MTYHALFMGEIHTMNIYDNSLAETIYTILQQGTITRAADTLFISQSALSRRIITAEKELGFPLFDRTQKLLRLTPQGSIYLNASMKINNIYQAMLSEMQEISSGDHGLIRLGLSISLSRGITHMFLPKFHAIFPNVELQLIEQASNKLEEMVYQNVVDVAIVHSRTSKELEYMEVTAMPVYLSVPEMYKDFSSLHRGVNHRTLDLITLSEYPFVLLKKSMSLRNLADTLFLRNNMEPKIAVETGSIEVADHLVQANIGFAFVPSAFISKDEGTYCCVSQCNELRPFYLCIRKSMYMTKAIEKLMEIVSDALIVYSNPKF